MGHQLIMQSEMPYGLGPLRSIRAPAAARMRWCSMSPDCLWQYRTWMRLGYLLVACLPVLGQTSGGSSVTKVPGDAVTLTISLNSQPVRAPIALQWEVVFPAQLMDLEGDPEIGSAARDASKALVCKPLKPYSYRCVLSGGEKKIGDGQVAIFHFRIRTTAAAGTSALRVERAAATTVDGKQEALSNTGATVIIH